MDKKIHLTAADIGKQVLLRNGETATIVSCRAGSTYPFQLRLAPGTCVWVALDGRFCIGPESPLDVVEVIGKPFEITAADVGRTVRLRDGETATVRSVDADGIYGVGLSNGTYVTGSGRYPLASDSYHGDAVAFADKKPVDQRAAVAAEQVGRFLAIESDRTTGELSADFCSIRGVFATRGEAEAFIREDTLDCWDPDGCGDPESFSSDWFIAEVTRVLRPVPVPATDATCRLDTLAEK